MKEIYIFIHKLLIFDSFVRYSEMLNAKPKSVIQSNMIVIKKHCIAKSAHPLPAGHY